MRVGGLADPLPYHFTLLVWPVSVVFKLFGALLPSPQSKTVISGLSPLFHLFGALLLSPQSKTVVSGLSPLFKLFSAHLLPLASSPFSCLLALSRISERAPTILYCFKSFLLLRDLMQGCD